MTGVFACSPATETIEQKATEFDKLLSRFKSISIDTLKVYSSNEKGEVPEKFKGIALDSMYAILFPSEIAELHFNNPGLFACYKFPLDSFRTALIARTPSEYVPSSIKLFIYDKQKNAMTNCIELSESWGDAGDSMEKKSWIFKNSKGNWEIFQWRKDCSYETENDETPVCDDSLTIFQFVRDKFARTNVNASALLKYREVFGQEEALVAVKKSTIINPSFPLKDLFGVWTLDPHGPHADFELDSLSFFIVDYDGEGSMAYTLHADTLKIDYGNYLSVNMIRSVTSDSLHLISEDGNLLRYVRWPE